MTSSYDIETTILPDGSVHVKIPGWVPGQRVRVIIALADGTEPSERALPIEERTGPSVIDLIRTLPGHRLFQTAEEVDAYVRTERDAWER